jgi:hypothetical protein
MRRGSRSGTQRGRAKKRTEPRPELRGRSFRVQLYESAADLGDSLLVVRAERRWEQAGSESFADYCRDLWPADWQLTPEQAEQMADAALELAAKRRQARRR